MARLEQSLVWDAAADRTFLVFLGAAALSLIRAADQPGIDLGAGGTSITIVPTDVVIAVLVVALVIRIVRMRHFPRTAVALTAAAGVFAALILVTGAANSSSALVAAGKLVELGALLVGAVVLVDSLERLWAVAPILVAMATVATAWAVVGWVQDPGSRQASFLGEHDFAALSTACFVVGLASLHTRPGSKRLPLVAGIVGALGITPRSGAREPARALPRRRCPDRRGGGARGSAPAPRGRDRTDRIGCDGRDVRPAGKRSRLPAPVVRAGTGPGSRDSTPAAGASG